MKNDTLFWLKKFVQNPMGIGAIAPSSAHLARLMLKRLPKKGRVLELGPGTGAITLDILKRVVPSRLDLIESDAGLAARCKKCFPGVQVTKGDAEHVLGSSKERYAAIISGIPFAGMNKAKRVRVFHLIHQHLAKDGIFVMFQYSLTTFSELQKEFGNVDISFTLRNIPPAFVFTAPGKGKKKK